MGLPAARRLKGYLSALDPIREWEQAMDLGISLRTWQDSDYPATLRSVPDAPLVLYVWGELDQERPALAVVGSRQPSPYGRRMTRSLVRDAAAHLVIVSGLARGIDTEAHRAALECGGVTWAVLGSGLGRIYPPENSALAHEIAARGGCVLSELPLAAEPLAAHFPLRNRIVAALSWGTVVVEGRDKSGALITARLAGEQGREVFAVPGPADSPLSEAPHRLISQGAKLARSMADIWPELPPAAVMPPSRSSAAERTLAEPHKKILELLGSETRSLEDLGQESGMDLPSLSQAMFEMELQDLVVSAPGQFYAKKSD
jgi:DNA processing protein